MSRIGYHFSRNLGNQDLLLKNIKNVKLASLNFQDLASTVLIDDYNKMLLDSIDCQKSVSGKQLV